MGYIVIKNGEIIAGPSSNKTNLAFYANKHGEGLRPSPMTKLDDSHILQGLSKIDSSGTASSTVLVLVAE